MKTILKVTGVFIFIVLAFLVVVGNYFLSDLCSNTIVDTKSSLDKKFKVVLFERSCGATTGFTSQISLIEFDQELENEPGNIYIAKGFPESYTLIWVSNSTVKILGHSGQIHKKEQNLKGVNFTFK